MSRKRVSEVSFVLIIIIALSKLLGFVRDMVIAGRFGSGTETDAYFIAVTASTVFFVLIGMALNTIIIPILSDIQNESGQLGANRYLSKLINITLIFTVLLTVLCFAVTPLLIRIIASGFTGEKFLLTVKLTRIGLPMMVTGGLVYILKGYLHVNRNFVVPALEGFAVSLPMILYILLLSERFGITGLMITALVTGFIRLLLYIPSVLVNGYRYNPKSGVFDKDIKRTIVLMMPVILGTLSGHINMIVDRTIASGLTEGSITALSFSHRLMSLATEMLALTVIAVVYATISGLLAEGKIDEFNKNVRFGINVVILLGIPASVGLITLGKPIVSLFYQRGAFTEADTSAMVSALAYYSVGITALCIADLMNKAIYSMKDTKTPMKIGIITVGVNIVLNIVLSAFMGHNGLALATSLAGIVSMVLLMVVFIKKSPGFKLTGSWILIGKAIAASAVMAFSVVLLSGLFNINQGSFILRLILLAVVVISSLMIYFILLYIMNVEEARRGFSLIEEKIKKKKPA